MAINLNLDVGNTYKNIKTGSMYKITKVASGPVKINKEWIHSRVVVYSVINPNHSLGKEEFLKLENDFLETMTLLEAIQ